MGRAMAAALVLTLGLCGAAWAGENLIQNGGFEEVKAESGKFGNVFEKWGAWVFEGEAKVAGDKEVKHGGAMSAQLSGKNPCRIALSQKVTLAAGMYKLTMWVRGDGLTENGGRAVKFGFETKGGSVKDTLPAGTYGWRKVERIYKITDAMADATFYIYLYGDGKCNIDDLSLEKAEGADLKEGMTLGEPEKAAAAEPAEAEKK